MAAASFDTLLKERELAAAAKTAANEEAMKRASIHYGAVRVPVTGKKGAAPFAAPAPRAVDQSPPQASRASMYVPTPMQSKTPRADLMAVPVTPSMPRLSMPAIRVGSLFPAQLSHPAPVPSTHAPSAVAAAAATSITSSLYGSSLSAHTFAAPSHTASHSVASSQFSSASSHASSLSSSSSSFSSTSSSAHIAPMQPVATLPSQAVLPASDILGSVPAGVDLDKLLDEALAAEEARTKALMESALAMPKAAERIAPLVRSAFAGTSALKPVAARIEHMVLDAADTWDAELAAITQLPAPVSVPARVMPEPVARQVEEPLDRIRSVWMECDTHGFTTSAFQPASAFKMVC